MSDERTPFNYRYFVGHAKRVGGRSLDYGCGAGDTVARGLAAGLDMWGADVFAGYYSALGDAIQPAVKDRVFRIIDQRADFRDGHFDLVMSNQVLEHVRDPERLIADVFRLLRPGGCFIAAFPVVETWYEGHVGLYFAHRLKAGSASRHAYFNLCHRLGFGLGRGELTRAQWIAMVETALDEACFYYPFSRVWKALEGTFGSPVEDIAVDYMRTRLGDRQSAVPRLADPLLRFVYHVRAGQVVSVRKPAAPN